MLKSKILHNFTYGISEGMDRIIEKKGLSKRQKWLIASVLFLAVIVIPSLTRHRTSTLVVEKDKITIREVVFDKYQDFISVNGIVEPFTTVYTWMRSNPGRWRRSSSMKAPG